MTFDYNKTFEANTCFLAWEPHCPDVMFDGLSESLREAGDGGKIGTLNSKLRIVSQPKCFNNRQLNHF